MVSIVVYKRGDTYYSTLKVGEAPLAPPSTQFVFACSDESNEDASIVHERLSQKAREEAKAMGIQKVVNLLG